ncbi:MAG: hypothetical protein DCF22_10685 [Leptolyngbya sp.]|nr:MAG: hypothetical protein DCF22_10685 [Leptolyngbya sp.]
MSAKLVKFPGFTIGLSVGASLFVMQSAHAAILTYDIIFSTSNEQVGTGEFGYDPDQTVSISYFVPGQSPPNQLLNVSNPLTSFSATVLGVQWQGVGLTKWLDPDLGLKGLISDRSPLFLVENWSFGKPPTAFGGGLLRLLGKESEAGVLEGFWFQGNLPQLGSGNWTATPRGSEAVPEPSTALGATLMGVGYLLYKKLGQFRDKK